MIWKLELFIHVVTPMSKVYGLPTIALHTFRDSDSPSSNLRYFEVRRQFFAYIQHSRFSPA